MESLWGFVVLKSKRETKKAERNGKDTRALANGLREKQSGGKE